jgi:hypothetical protein
LEEIGNETWRQRPSATQRQDTVNAVGYHDFCVTTVWIGFLLEGISSRVTVFIEHVAFLSIYLQSISVAATLQSNSASNLQPVLLLE